MFHFERIYDSLPFLISGVFVTLKYTLCALVIGSVIGLFTGLARRAENVFIRKIASAYVSVFLGTPLLLQLTITYYAVPQFFNIQVTAFCAGVIAFSLNSGAYVAEIVRAGINGVDRGQFEAAKALGIPYHLMMRDIILPQAFKNILPALINEMINLLKESTLLSVIGEMDLLRRATIVAAEKYLYFEPLIVVAAIYYLLVISLSKVASVLEKRMARSD